jgi:hypothetical protein
LEINITEQWSVDTAWGGTLHCTDENGSLQFEADPNTYGMEQAIDVQKKD